MWTVGEFAGDKQNAKMNEDEVMTVMFWNAAARHNRYSTTDGGVGGAAAAAAAAMFMNGKWLMMSVSFRFVCVCVRVFERPFHTYFPLFTIKHVIHYKTTI